MNRELRTHSKYRDDWQIYSGGNNPVMNWGGPNNWLTRIVNGSEVQFYREFNYEEPVLKIASGNAPNSGLPQLSPSDMTILRERTAALCESFQFTDNEKRKRNRGGVYSSIYKWIGFLPLILYAAVASPLAVWFGGP
ncbi:hypothetical protein QWJ34_01300 [Saccharibacillus sp. CPCC 101409]|uniref:hypothetical protein n=1 Tax=Saccharibacillus sp. CPCC 101409 TaxID=3058041 RepID=UPI002671FCF5|nr:hypothetical protein [Saccharibacillus sp. CPCC 101409]MDO3408396.1 hypothetical protein [Saccharibacillus sp. CPCC 101409]